MQTTIHSLESAPPESRPWMEALASDIGFVPNLAAAMSESPAWIQAFVNARRAFGDANFTAAERELILLVVAVEARNAYGVAVHSTVALGNGVAAETVEAVRLGDEPRGARHRILAAAVRALVRHGRLDPAAAAALEQEGFTPRCLIDLTVGVSVGLMVALAHHLAPETPLDPPFAPRAWLAPAGER